MKTLIILATLVLNLMAQSNGLLETSKNCLETINESFHLSITQDAKATSDNKLVWIEDDNLIYQSSERATIFKLKLSRGLNLISLANNKGRELEIVCIQKEGRLTYIDSIGSSCMSKTKKKYKQTISYAGENYESNDLISNKIFKHLNDLRISFKNNVNRKMCDSYIDTYKKCFFNYSNLTGKSTIPRTEARYRFVLKELGRTLKSQCQKA